MEYWDLYDENKNKLNKKIIRGEKLNNNEFHLVTNVWIKNSENKFLITKRIETKPHPLKWETNGGSAISGETSLDAAIRETYEETGIKLNKSDAILVGETLRYFKHCPDICSEYLFKINSSDIKVTIQESEVVDYKWATVDEIKELQEKDQLLITPFFEKIMFENRNN